ncbi:MAG: fibrobacter succinogenes major paralogous domain-containing protein [Marinilabiliaceae bacterium]|nr:fibrobacter succinogenes major paralogous domain-containing protein [Marinilabiliaceae bacterium]
MQTRLIIYSAFAVMLWASGCKEAEDEPSQIPTIPTEFSIKDGAEITDLKVTLSASGSTVEDNGLNVSYVYYIGKSADALEKTSAEVTLEPYIQYFWCAQAKTEAGEGEKTDVRTFYCVPGFDVTTDNGDGIYAAIIKWNKADKFQSVTVSATANHDGYELEPQTITDGADSCYFVRKRDASDPTKDNAFVQWWDDEHGIYAEPVVYDFTVEAKVQVGDKTFTLTNSAKECILDKQYVVRDHEFNVYRVVKIGGQTWLADDLRLTSYIDEKGDTIKWKLGEDYLISTLKSGATGFLYPLYYYGINHFIKGYRLPSDDDFSTLEEMYGLARPTAKLEERTVNSLANFMIIENTQSQFYQPEGKNEEIVQKLASPYDWENMNVTTNNPFNAKPFGVGENYGNGRPMIVYSKTQGYAACYLTSTDLMSSGGTRIFARILVNTYGIHRNGFYVSCGELMNIRLIKE